MHLRPQRPPRLLFPLSLVLITITLVATAPVGRSPGFLVASSSPYLAPRFRLFIYAGDPGSPAPEVALIRSDVLARKASFARVLRLRRAAAWRAAQVRPVQTYAVQPQPRTWTPAPLVRSGGVNWYAIAQCESGGRWSYNGPSGFDGGLQFLPSTWSSLHMGYAYAWQAPASVQIAGAQKLLAEVGGRGWTQWPVCWWRQ
jgi:transglycosylase-like protein